DPVLLARGSRDHEIGAEPLAAELVLAEPVAAAREPGQEPGTGGLDQEPSERAMAAEEPRAPFIDVAVGVEEQVEARHALDAVLGQDEGVVEVEVHAHREIIERVPDFTLGEQELASVAVAFKTVAARSGRRRAPGAQRPWAFGEARAEIQA